MKVKDIMDYFGPRLNCPAKLHYLGEDIIFETDGFEMPENEDILESYIIDIDIKEKDGIHYLDLTMEA